MQREFVQRAIGGDHGAFTSLVDASIDRQYALATLILRDRDRAQDAVQEALVSAWRDVRSLRDPDAWDAWLHRLTVWACYRMARKERSTGIKVLSGSPSITGNTFCGNAVDLQAPDGSPLTMDGNTVCDVAPSAAP